MKVLIVTETLNEGGAELFVLRLARKLNAMGVSTDVLSLNKAYENKQMTALFTDVPIVRLSLPALYLMELFDRLLLKLNIDFSIKYFIQTLVLRKRLKGKYDIIHTNYIRIDYLFSRLNSKKFFKHLVTVHGDYSAHYYKTRNKEHVGWLHVESKLLFLTANVDHWAVISDEQQSFFLEKMHLQVDKITKIYNGFETKDHAQADKSHINKPQNTFTIGMVARGVEDKGWQLLINAFLKLPTEGSSLILVGSSQYLDQLKKTYANQSNIIFTGFHPNPVELIRNFDVFVLPTVFPYESLPNVITEALFCGTPIIVTRVGEIEQMITDPETRQPAGVLLDIEGRTLRKDQLFNTLNHFYNNRDEIKRLHPMALRAFVKFDMNKCASSYLDLYKKLIS